MSEATLERAALLNLFEQNPDPRVGAAARTALSGLGWSEKATFTREDMLAVTWRIAADARQDLLASDNPELVEAGEAFGPLVELTRKQVAKAHPANA